MTLDEAIRRGRIEGPGLREIHVRVDPRPRRWRCHGPPGERGPRDTEDAWPGRSSRARSWGTVEPLLNQRRGQFRLIPAYSWPSRGSFRVRPAISLEPRELAR